MKNFIKVLLDTFILFGVVGACLLFIWLFVGDVKTLTPFEQVTLLLLTLNAY